MKMWSGSYAESWYSGKEEAHFRANGITIPSPHRLLPNTWHNFIHTIPEPGSRSQQHRLRAQVLLRNSNQEVIKSVKAPCVMFVTICCTYAGVTLQSFEKKSEVHRYQVI
jgi:hypothetical protein